jgi:hypothetical protein
VSFKQVAVPMNADLFRSLPRGLEAIGSSKLSNCITVIDRSETTQSLQRMRRRDKEGLRLTLNFSFAEEKMN